MGFIQTIKDKFTSVEQKLLKYLATNKVFIQAVIKYVSLAYTSYEGKQKMVEAVKFLLILCKMDKITDEEATRYADIIEKSVQTVYDQMKAKDLV